MLNIFLRLNWNKYNNGNNNFLLESMYPREPNRNQLNKHSSMEVFKV